MAIDPSKAFEINDGVILSEGGPGLFSGSVTPTETAPPGSMFFKNDGTFYQYAGGSWVQQGVGSGSGGGFNYHHIPLDSVITIPLDQHMTSRNLSIEGFLVVEGGLEMS